MKKLPVCVAIYAVDWAITHEQVSTETSFEPMHGWIAGMLVRETEETLSICLEWFDEGQVRDIVTIPKICIKKRVQLTPDPDERG